MSLAFTCFQSCSDVFEKRYCSQSGRKRLQYAVSIFIRAIPVRHSSHSYPCPYTILIFHCFATLQGRNRSRMQQPHHRNLMKSKQLSKRREVAKKRHERQTETAEGEKTVTVSGALGPFSLLLQVCFINKKRKKTRKTSYV